MRSGRPVLAVALAAVAGCGSGDDGRILFDPQTVESFVRNEVARTTKDLTVGPVRCPATLDTAVGATSKCAVELDGVTTSYLVQVLAGRRFEARPEHPIVDLRRIEAQIAEKSGQGTSATCGPVRIVQLTPTQKVTCGITGAGPPRKAVVTADADGTVRVTDG